MHHRRALQALRKGRESHYELMGVFEVEAGTPMNTMYSKAAVIALKKMGPFDCSMILKWIDAHVEGCFDPRAHGKALTGDLSGLWRYRVGKYRVLCQLLDDRLVVMAMVIGHQREVYD